MQIKLEIVLGGLCSRAHVSPEPTALHFCGFNIVNLTSLVVYWAGSNIVWFVVKGGGQGTVAFFLTCFKLQVQAFL